MDIPIWRERDSEIKYKQQQTVYIENIKQQQRKANKPEQTVPAHEKQRLIQHSRTNSKLPQPKSRLLRFQHL